MLFSDVLDRNVPTAVLRACLDLIVGEYRRTHGEVSRRYERAEAADVLPHIRRANIETGLQELADRFPDQLTVTVGRTKSGNFYRHVKCGQIIFTQSYVEPGRRVPREAVFRVDFAGNQNQMWLHPDDEAERKEKIKARESTYVILTHTPLIDNPAEPAYVSATLVGKGCQYLEAINLADHLALAAARATEPEVIPDRRIAALRKDAVAAPKKGA